MTKIIVKAASIILIILAVILIYKKAEQNYIKEQKSIELQMKATRMKK
ncbi:hypothetical protein ACFL03_13550 [Thermodesulfobacteriota bacterium]